MKQRSPTFRAFLATGLVLCASLAHAAEPGIANRVIQTKAAGIDILIYPMDVKNVVSMVGTIPLGDAAVAARKTNAVVPEFTVSMMGRGTAKQSKFQISDALARKGATLDMGSDETRVDIRGRSLRTDLGMVIQLLADELRSPKFSQAELDKLKVEAKAGLQNQQDDVNARAREAMTLALYPASHPAGTLSNAELGKAVNKVTLADLQSFHKRTMGPAHMTLVFTGDVDPKEVERLVGAAFAGWSGGVPSKHWGAGEHLTPTVLSKDIELTDKAAVAVRWGTPTGLVYSDADALPLKLGTDVLGSGFTSRLLGTVRDKEGLTYGIGADAQPGNLFGGDFTVTSSFAPELLERGMTSTRRELDKWYREGITNDELKTRKTAAIGSQRLALGTTGGMAYALLSTVIRGEPISTIDTYADRVNAVTVDQVNAAIRKYGDPSKMMVVRAGTFPKK